MFLCCAQLSLSLFFYPSGSSLRIKTEIRFRKLVTSLTTCRFNPLASKSNNKNPMKKNYIIDPEVIEQTLKFEWISHGKN